MNAPHVVALIYDVDHEDLVIYDEAEPLIVEEKEFRLEVKDKKASFYLKNHYATEAEARKAIEEYIRNWEFDACLQGGPDRFKLNFDRAQIEDRNPTPEVVKFAVQVRVGIPGVRAGVSVVVSNYPSPPSDISVTPDVQTMYDRYMGHRRDREPLMGMAYFCYTFIKHLGKGLQAAAQHFQISKNVLVKIRRLSSTKGGPREARKQEGVYQDLTTEERQFLEEAVKKMIRRVAEKANAPDKDLQEITLADLPPCK